VTAGSRTVRIPRRELDALQQRLFAVALGLRGLRSVMTDTTRDATLRRIEVEIDALIRDVRSRAVGRPAEPKGRPSRAGVRRLPDEPELRSPAVPPTVVVVDDHEVVREGIRSALERDQACRVVGEAGTIAEAHEVIAQEAPHVVILDVVLPDGDGIQLCREVRARHPATACVLLTSFPEPRGMLSAALAGAAAYLGKDGEATDLVATVDAVAAGERMLEPETIAAMLDAAASAPEDDPRVGRLTSQERRVFELIGQGLSNRQIADRLHLTEHTVKNYSSRMLSKLEMERRSEAAVLSARLAERRAQRDARGHAP
jgi:two-component system, NarL family, response regulator DevR